MLAILSLLSVTACTPFAGMAIATPSSNSSVAPSESIASQTIGPATASQDGESPSIVADPNQETILTVATDNLLVIDVSNGKAAFPMPANERRFASNEMLASFAQRHLAAKAIMNNAVPLAFTVQIQQTGTLTWWDAQNNKLYEVTDPVLAFLGGVSGRIWINDQPVCLDPDQLCDNTPASYLLGMDTTGNHANLPRPKMFHARAALQTRVLSQLDECTNDNSFCTQFYSFYNKVDLAFFRYIRAGAGTKVTQGTAGETIRLVPCDANNTPLDAVVQQVKVTIQTGDDDLRGGNDNAFARLEYSDGTSDEVYLNDGASWGNNSVHGKSFTLPSHRTLGDIVGFSIHTTFGGGISGDNWNVNQLLVEYFGPNGNGTLLSRQGNPFLRFTGQFQEWMVDLSSQPAPMQCARSIPPKLIAVTGAALVKLNHDPGTGAAGWDTIALNGAEARGQNAVEVEAWGFFLAGEIEAGGDIRPDLDAPEFELFTFEGICSAHQGDTLFGQTGNGDFEGALDAGLCPSS